MLWEYLAKLAFSVAVTAAERAGIINGFEAFVIRKEHDVASGMKTLRKYPAFDPLAPTNIHNFVTGQKLEP